MCPVGSGRLGGYDDIEIMCRGLQGGSFGKRWLWFMDPDGAIRNLELQNGLGEHGTKKQFKERILGTWDWRAWDHHVRVDINQGRIFVR